MKGRLKTIRVRILKIDFPILSFDPRPLPTVFLLIEIQCPPAKILFTTLLRSLDFLSSFSPDFVRAYFHQLRAVYSTSRESWWDSLRWPTSFKDLTYVVFKNFKISEVFLWNFAFAAPLSFIIPFSFVRIHQPMLQFFLWVLLHPHPRTEPCKIVSQSSVQPSFSTFFFALTAITLLLRIASITGLTFEVHETRKQCFPAVNADLLTEEAFSVKVAIWVYLFFIFLYEPLRTCYLKKSLFPAIPAEFAHIKSQSLFGPNPPFHRISWLYIIDLKEFITTNTMRRTHWSNFSTTWSSRTTFSLQVVSFTQFYLKYREIISEICCTTLLTLLRSCTPSMVSPNLTITDANISE